MPNGLCLQPPQSAPKLSGCSGATAERLGLRKMVDVAVSEWGDIHFRRLALGIVVAPFPNAAFPRLRVLSTVCLGFALAEARSSVGSAQARPARWAAPRD